MQTAPAMRAAVAPPMEMQTARRWLLWSSEPRRKPDGSTYFAKVPRYLDGDRRRGDLNNDGTRLSTYAEACASLAMWGAAMSGLGFALGEGWQGIDFDKVAQRPELAALVEHLPGYVELSPSGNGWHAVGYGAPFATLGSNSSGIEAYCEGRFFTFTGHALRAGQQLVDLSPFISSELVARHAAHRRQFKAQPMPARMSTGDRTVDEIVDALRYLDADDRHTWVKVGHALYALGEQGREIWSAWSATSEKFPGGDDLERWDGFSGERTGYASIFVQAAANGWKNPRKLDPAAIFAGSEFVAPPMTQAANAPSMPMPAVALMPMPMPPATGATPAAPPVPAYTGPDTAVGRLSGQDHREPDGKLREASIQNVVDAIGPASGMSIRYDTFQDAILIGSQANQYRPFTDNDYAKLRITLGRGGFKPVSPEAIRSAVGVVAESASFDSAQVWAESLVWDGVPRVDTAMSRYYRTVDTPYTRAVGAYLFTALAGRALVHPLQADMVVILVGLQGARKTSAVAALAPTPAAFGEVNLSKSDDDLARRLRGKLVVEWAEMRGLVGRDQESIKAWTTRRTESWVPKYKEFATTFDRRCIPVGTANTNELLDDPTGERRWLPVNAGEVDVDGLMRDRDQLWAEGAVRFRADGVAWADAERLARAEHAAFKVSDDWAGPIYDWLVSAPIPKMGEKPCATPNGDKPFKLVVCANEALNLRIADLKKSESDRIGKILRNFGFEPFNRKISGAVLKFWQRSVALPE